MGNSNKSWNVFVSCISQLYQTCIIVHVYRTCISYMYVNFQQNRVSRSVKIVHTNLFANNRKLHKIATCNSNFEKSLFSDTNHLISHIYKPLLRSVHVQYIYASIINFDMNCKLYGIVAVMVMYLKTSFTHYYYYYFDRLKLILFFCYCSYYCDGVYSYQSINFRNDDRYFTYL